MQEFLTGKSIPMLNENGIHNILVDVDFLEAEFKGAGRPQLMAAFGELRAVSFPFLRPRISLTLSLHSDCVYRPE